jgi:E3 ubiquitin-protein ligase MARCH5
MPHIAVFVYYIMSFDIAGPIVQILDIIERSIQRACPFVAGGIVIGSVFWSAVTYGAVTVMQVQDEILT